jgi:hypothetical protein
MDFESWAVLGQRALDHFTCHSAGFHNRDSDCFAKLHTHPVGDVIGSGVEAQRKSTPGPKIADVNRHSIKLAAGLFGFRKPQNNEGT